MQVNFKILQKSCQKKNLQKKIRKRSEQSEMTNHMVTKKKSVKIFPKIPCQSLTFTNP